MTSKLAEITQSHYLEFHHSTSEMISRYEPRNVLPTPKPKGQSWLRSSRKHSERNIPSFSILHSDEWAKFIDWSKLFGCRETKLQMIKVTTSNHTEWSKGVTIEAWLILRTWTYRRSNGMMSITYENDRRYK